jgi:hypothetical protein
MDLIFDLSDFENYKAYFQQLATEHLDIGANNFLFGDVEVGQNEAREWQGKKLWAWPSQRGRMSDSNADNYLLNREGSVWLGGPAQAETFADTDTYYNDCEKLAKQIVARIIKDKQDAKLSTSFSSITIQRADMKLGATDFVGCEILITWVDPTGFEYDETKWS